MKKLLKIAAIILIAVAMKSQARAMPMECMTGGWPEYVACDAYNAIHVSIATGTYVTALISPRTLFGTTASATLTVATNNSFACPGTITGGCSSVTVVNETTTNHVHLCLNTACTDTTGIYLGPGAAYTIENATLTSVQIWPITGNATVSMIWGGR